MGRAALMVFASPVPGRTEELVEWYDRVHIPDVRKAVPAIRNAVRYLLVDPSAGPQEPPRFVTVYDLGDTDPAAAAAALAAGEMELSPALDLTENPPEMRWGVRDSGEL